MPFDNLSAVVGNAIIGCSSSGTTYNLYTGTNRSCVNLPNLTILDTVYGPLGYNTTVDNYTIASIVNTSYEK